jgi:serine/threonine protein kinase
MSEQESVFNSATPIEPSPISSFPDVQAVGQTQLISLISNHSAESDVWLGERPDGEQVAVKIYRYGRIPGLVDTTHKCALSHPNLVPVLEAGEIQGRYFEISPFIRGGTLADLIQRRGRLAESELETILDQLSEVIHYLHSRHVLHRDIKPTNVFVLSEAPLKVALADFGTARLGAYQTMLTGNIGTIAYSSPEAVTGIQSEAADYWSLGTVLLEALTGRRPLEGLDVKQQLYRVASGQIEIPEAIPSRWKELFEGLLRTDYTERWRKQDIGQWLKTVGTVSTKSVELNPRTGRRPEMRPASAPRANETPTLIRPATLLVREPERITLTISDISRLVFYRAAASLGRFFWLFFLVNWYSRNFWVAAGVLAIIAVAGIGIDFLPHNLERLQREARVERQLAGYSPNDRRLLRRLVRHWMQSIRHDEPRPPRDRTRRRAFGAMTKDKLQTTEYHFQPMRKTSRR